MRTFEQLEQTCKAMGYKFFYNSTNIIGERTSDLFTDNFTDYLHIVKNNKVTTIPWTTKAGLFYVKNPVTAWGTNVKTGVYECLKGTAILKEGQYINCYQFVDNYWQWLTYPYFYQIASVDVYRDANLDTKIDRNSPIHRGKDFGINLHRMSNNGQAVGIIHNWSAGCNGAVEPEFKKLLIPVREDVKRFGNIFSYTLLKSDEICY